MKLSTWELFLEITDYNVEFMTQEFKTIDPIRRTTIIKKKKLYIYLDEIPYTEVFAVADAKTRDTKIT